MKNTFSFRFSPSTEDPAEILLVYAIDECDPARVAMETADEASRDGAPDEIAIVASVKTAEKIREYLSENSTEQRRIDNLLPAIKLSILGFDRHGDVAFRKSLPERPIGSPLDLGKAFIAGVTELFNLRGGEIRSRSGFHFQHPSQRHSQSFLRLSNLLVRDAEVCFLAAALLAHVPEEATFAYLDTPSLFSLVSALNRLLAGFGAQRLRADNFGSYGGWQRIALDAPQSTVVLISASTSGGLAQRIMGKHGLRSEQIVHILYLGKERAAFPVVCNLTNPPNSAGLPPPVERFATGNCRLCDGGSIPVLLQGDQFEIGAPDNVAIELERRPAIAKSVSIIARDLIPDSDLEPPPRALRVNTVSTEQGLFEVNVEELLRLPKFRERLDYVIMRAAPQRIRAVIYLSDPGSKALGRYVADYLGIEQGKIISDKQLQQSRLPAPTSDGSILVVGGVLNSGRTFRSLGVSLRLAAPDAPIVYLVGFSKTPTPGLEKMRATLTYTPKAIRHEVAIVASLPLPDRGFVNPWVQESNVLKSIEFRAIEGADLEIFEKRIAFLASDKAKYEGLFWETGNNAKLGFTKGFAFWDSEKYDHDLASEADVFFAISSALQTMREADDGRSLRASAFRHPVLSDETFARYSDPLIQASLLRAAEPAELNYLDYPTQSKQVGRVLTRLVKGALALRGSPTMEVLVALATERLRLAPNDALLVANAVADSGAAPPHFKTLALYIKAREHRSAEALVPV